MAYLNEYFYLKHDSYTELIEIKDKVQKEYDAQGVIVLTANMNVPILMKDILDRKKRVIARIDATKEGQNFLKELVSECLPEELELALKRLKTGKTILLERKRINKELLVFQNESKRIANIEEKEYLYLLLRFIQKHKTQIKDIRDSFAEEQAENFAYKVLIEELSLLSKEVRHLKSQVLFADK